MKAEPSMSIAGGPPAHLNNLQRLFTLIGLGGVFALIVCLWYEPWSQNPNVLWSSLASMFAGVVGFSWASYRNQPPGIKNNRVWFHSISSMGFWGWIAGIAITAFYIMLYFYPETLGLHPEGGPNTGIVSLFDPLSRMLSGNPASQWFVYGSLYTLAILAFGVKFIWKYRHNTYQLIRTISVMFFQLSFAFIIPEFMARLNGDRLNLPYYDLKNIWPLNYYNFEKYRISGFLSSGDIGLALLIFGIASIFVITPLLTYFYGKRWYCSWVCGCGGLAETAGDPFRHLSDKTTRAWKIERWVIHSVLVFVVLMTTAVVYSYLGEDQSKYWLTKSTFLWTVGFILTAVFLYAMVFKREEFRKDARAGAIAYFAVIIALIMLHVFGDSRLFLFKAETLRKSYSFLIGSVFSGVIGVGFYPIFGSRVWCRFGCPMAAILGFQQRLFSRFRITTNGGQCISCGNCSTYCEMGIDVRAYAQKGANIVRSSCVGCGICSAVCPRGVLKLENGPLKGRINSQEVLLGNDVDLMNLVNQNR